MSSVSLAFVDSTGKVTLVLNTDKSLATSFTTSAHIIDVSALDIQPNIDWSYDGTTFSAPPEPLVNPLTDNITPLPPDNPNPTE
jgi:hypothetical protein